MEQRAFPKIIMHMKQRFQKDENFPISLEEILEELQIVDLTKQARNVLDTQILCTNPKLESIIDEGVRKYTFKPSFTIRNRKELINLIKENQTKGLGGVLMEDVQESMTTDEFERIFKKPGDEIQILMGKGKKKVLFYNEKLTGAENIQVEDDIIKYWRDVPVEGLDETKIEEYLEKQGIAQMKDTFAQKNQIHIHKRKSHKGRQVKKHNEHLGNLLNEYNPDFVKK